MSTDNLVEALGGTETGRSHANDEDIDVAAPLRSVGERLEPTAGKKTPESR